MSKIIYLLLAITTFGCTGSKIVALATEGEVSKQSFNEEIKADYIGKLLFVEVGIKGKTYPFLFDTGYDFTMVDHSLIEELDFRPVIRQKTGGSSFETQKLQYGYLASLSIGGIAFHNIGIGVQDLSMIKSPYPDKRKIYGIIGTNVLRKAYWHLDYQRENIQFSNSLDHFSPAKTSYKIPMKPRNASGWGYNKIEVGIDGVSGSFIFDTGSAGGFTANPDFWDRYVAANSSPRPISKEADRQTYLIQQLRLGEIKKENVAISIEKNVRLLMGNDFLEDFSLTIDWENNYLYLAPVNTDK